MLAQNAAEESGWHGQQAALGSQNVMMVTPTATGITTPTYTLATSTAPAISYNAASLRG